MDTPKKRYRIKVLPNLCICITAGPLKFELKGPSLGGGEEIQISASGGRGSLGTLVGCCASVIGLLYLFCAYKLCHALLISYRDRYVS